MRGIFGMLGCTALGGVGWWLGDFIGIWSAVVLSAVGSGIGLYIGRRFVEQWLP